MTLATGRLVKDVTAMLCSVWGLTRAQVSLYAPAQGDNEIRAVYRCKLTATSSGLGFCMRCKPSRSLMYVTASASYVVDLFTANAAGPRSSVREEHVCVVDGYKDSGDVAQSVGLSAR